jgi:hypothetical protein
MGCNDRSDPTPEEVAYEERERRVISDIHKVPLSKLTVADSLFIHGAFFHRYFGINSSDLDRMEEILKRVHV